MPAAGNSFLIIQVLRWGYGLSSSITNDKPRTRYSGHLSRTLFRLERANYKDSQRFVKAEEGYFQKYISSPVP